MTQGHLNETADADLGYGQLFAILVRRRFWLLSIFVGVLSISTLVTLKTKPTYQSTMQLLVEPNYPQKQTLEGTVEPPQTGDDDYATQLALMQSSQFTEEVVARLRTDYPDLEGADIEENLSLTRVEAGGEETQIFAATYTDSDSAKTQKVLETLQQVYQEYNLEQDKLRLTQGLAFINEQSAAARERLSQLESDLEAFRADENFIDPQQQADTVAKALNEIEQERRTLRAQYQDAQARYEALQEQLQRDPAAGLTASRLSQSSRYQALLDELQTIELTLTEKRLRLTDAHPDVRVLLEQRQRLIDLLADEQQRVLGDSEVSPLEAGESLQQTGQLGETEQDLVAKLLEVQTELQGLQARSQTLIEMEGELRAELDRFPKAIAEYNRLQPEVDIQRNTITQLLESRQALSQELARGGFTWQIVEPPQEGRKIAPSPKKNLMLGAVVGLFLGGVAAFLRESLDDRIHDTDRLQQGLGVPLLGIVPQLPRAKVKGGVWHRPFRLSPMRPPDRDSWLQQAIAWQPFRESVDLVYQNICQTVPRREVASRCPSLLVTSAVAGEGKSTVVLSLALSAARLHQKVLLVDGNLRRPTLHEKLGLSESPGLSAWLSGATEEIGIQTISVLDSTFDLLAAGLVPADPVKLLSSQRMAELIAEVEPRYDLILWDAPSVLGTVDVLQMAWRCCGVVMVARLDGVTQAELTQAISAIERSKLLGIVANGGESASASYLTSVARPHPLPPSIYPMLENQRYDRN